jgi:hypothetical protein
MQKLDLKRKNGHAHKMEDYWWEQWEGVKEGVYDQNTLYKCMKRS